MKKIMMILNVMLILMLGTGTVVFADAIAYDIEEAGYYVYVATPDGGLNMRHGPGTEYDRVMNYRIPDGVKLYIGYTSDNWGLTTYDGNKGWVALKQTTTTPPAPKKTPNPTVAPTPIPTEEQIPVETEEQIPDATEEVQNTELAVSTENTSESTQEEDSQTIERIMRGQIGLVAILVLLIIIIAVLLVIIINLKSKKK